MNATRIAVLSAGVLGLALAGLYSWLPATDNRGLAETAPEPAPKAPGVRWREQPANTRAIPPRSMAQPSSVPAVAPQAGNTDVTDSSLSRATLADLDQALNTARQHTDPQQRIEALQFLGEHALQEHLQTLQQIQIQDPAPEVRRAAEEAANTLMARFMGQPWPGVPSGEDPLGYMRGGPSPAPP